MIFEKWDGMGTTSIVGAVPPPKCPFVVFSLDDSPYSISPSRGLEHMDEQRKSRPKIRDIDGWACHCR